MTIVNKHLMKIKPYQPGRPIEEVKRELGLKDVVKLASNENPYPPSPKVLAALGRAARSVNRYPDGGCYYLRRAMARLLKVDPRQLVFANGSDELIILCLRAFARSGDEIITAKPTFLIYEIAARVIGARVKPIPLKDFHYDLDRMAAAVSARTRMIFIGNPDNPGGQYIPAKDLQRFLNRIPKRVMIFMDEAYYEYAVHQADYPDTIRQLARYPNMIISRTFSKMYGLAGLRIGYGVGTLKVIDVVNRVKEPFNVNSLAQAAAVACIQDRPYYRGLAREIERQRRYLYKQLTDLGVSFVPTYTNFILIHVGRKACVMARQLLQRGMIVRDMSAWGLKDYIRVTFGTEAENRQFIKVFRTLYRQQH